MSLRFTAINNLLTNSDTKVAGSSKITEIFGSKEDAELWVSKPAMGLDGQRPIDLLQTVQGAELVNDFLGRLEYGVYT